MNCDREYDKTKKINTGKWDEYNFIAFKNVFCGYFKIQF